MAADWIKIEHCLPGKPEVMELSRLLGIDEMAVVGHLVCFWSWVDQNLSPECPDASGTKRGLDRVAGRDGFVDAMVEVGWLLFDGHTVRIPNYDHHLSQSAKKRALEARKKTRQRNVSRKCPADNGTTEGQKEGPEKRREEINNIGGELREYTIPRKLENPECQAAADKWFAYLRSKGLEDKSPEGNEIALGEWWLQMGRLGKEGFLTAVSQSISSGRWNVRLDSTPESRAPKQKQSDEWIEAVKAAQQYPSDWEKRKSVLGDELFEALKLTGTAKVANANSFELKTLESLFESHLKDIRNGIPVSN
jgi:hypothetical protein